MVFFWHLHFKAFAMQRADVLRDYVQNTLWKATGRQRDGFAHIVYRPSNRLHKKWAYEFARADAITRYRLGYFSICARRRSASLFNISKKYMPIQHRCIHDRTQSRGRNHGSFLYPGGILDMQWNVHRASSGMPIHMITQRHMFSFRSEVVGLLAFSQ